MSLPTDSEICVDGTWFTFPNNWLIERFDTWKQFRSAAGRFEIKGVGIVAIDDRSLWLIEMKDYTYAGTKPPADLARILGQKAIGTMALLYALARAISESVASEFAKQCDRCTSINLALHVDIKNASRKHAQITSLLMPLQDEVNKVRTTLHLAHGWATSSLTPNKNTPWTARRDPERRTLHDDR